MKLHLDTTAKTITVEGTVNLSELFEALKKLLPQGEWKEFSLNTSGTIFWVNPITIPIYPQYPYNPYPWWGSPIITCGTTSIPYNGNTSDNVTYKLNEGTYCVQI